METVTLRSETPLPKPQGHRLGCLLLNNQVIPVCLEKKTLMYGEYAEEVTMLNLGLISVFTARLDITQINHH